MADGLGFHGEYFQSEFESLCGVGLKKVRGAQGPRLVKF